MSEQEAFDNWYNRESPTGDSDSVKRQWEMSYDYAEFITKAFEMSEKDTGGPAFPRSQVHVMKDGEVMGVEIEGMTLRDWFAGKGLEALITHAGNPCTADATNYAKCAYAYADAMIQERSK